MGVGGDAFLDLARAQAMAGHVDHVVGTAQDEEVAVLVAYAPVEGAVDHAARNALPVGVDEALVVTPDGLHAARRQRPFDGQHALLPGAEQFLARGLVDQLDVIAIDGLARAAEARGLLLHAVAQREDGPAGLGLPVVVDDGLAQGLADPLRRGLVQRLAGQPQRLEAGDIVAVQVLGIVLLEHADGRRRREHVGDPVLLHDAPPDARVGAYGQALVEHGGHARDQGPIDDVAVPHDPADVAGAEKGLARLGPEDQRHAGGQRHRVAARVALHALGAPRGAAGVERVAGVGGFHPGAGDLGVGVQRTQAGPVVVAAGAHGRRRQATVHDEHGRWLVAGQLQGLVQQRLVGHDAPAARARVGTDDDLGLGIVDARGQRRRRKAAEHHRMDGTQPRTGQHGKGRLGNHGHVDLDAVALLHAQRLQHGGHALHLGMQFAVGIDLLGAGLGGDGDQRILVGALGQVPVHGVVAKIGLAAHEPLGERRVVIVADVLGRHMPVDAAGLLGPEGIALLDGAAVEIVETRGHCLSPVVVMDWRLLNS